MRDLCQGPVDNDCSGPDRLSALPPRLIRRLRGEEAGRTGPRRVPVRPDLGPAVPKDIAQVPACLYRGTEQLLVRGPAMPAVLPKAEEHLRQAPACAEQLIRLIGKLTALLHQTMAEGDVKVQGPLPECLWEIAAVLSAV